MKRDCCRSIGTGKDTSVWKSPWLTCAETGYLTTSMPQKLAEVKVCDLMEINERRWDDGILNDQFNTMDAHLMQNIHLPSRDKNDS